MHMSGITSWNRLLLHRHHLRHHLRHHPHHHHLRQLKIEEEEEVVVVVVVVVVVASWQPKGMNADNFISAPQLY